MMKKLVLLIIACSCFLSVHAAYLRNVPKTLTQPDGSVLHCYASGDEYFNYLHDANGYTIIQHPRTGFYVYADKRDGKLVATEYVADRVDPASKNLQPFNLISPEEWMARRNAWHEKERRDDNRDVIPNHGTLNNISIFIRFSDDEEFTNTFSSIDNMFNDVSEGAVSLRSYFRAASYGAIEIPTTFYPGHNGDVIVSYQDTYPHSYFEPYNESTNPNGYQDNERAEREFSLLERAVNYINAYYPVPTDLNIDYDADGYVDNVCFIVHGDVGEWSSLLWPHKWALQDRTVRINGKRVWTFNFQLADATDYFNTSTMCHEMNHSLGAPDLYHYYHGESLHPVGTWDLMEYNMTPPQHCGAYMKMKYSHWVDDIPEITEAGTYTLNPVSSATPTNIAYKIASDDPNQFYVLEYRDNTSLFETALPGSGLLIYRIDTRFDGNVNYNPDNGVYDEVYLFRPGGSSSSNGNFYTAHFSADVGRTEFSSITSAYPFFSEGTPDYNFRIFDITSAGNTITFSYDPESTMAPVQVFADYYPDVVDPTSPYVKVHWGNGISNIENFERGDFSLFAWQLDPTYPWSITTNNPYEGNYCMKSTNEGVHNSVSSMTVRMTIPNDGQISFYSKISSENNYDFGRFYIDNVQMGSYSGNGSWGERTFAVTAGAHTFKWAYTKDGSVNRNDDCFYVDYIRFYSSDAFAYDFDDSRLPTGWTTIDADGDGYNWSMGADVMSAGYGHYGSNDMVLSQSYNFTQGVLYPDNYLVSEQVTITNGSHFTFWACAQDANWAAEHFGVFVSLGSNSNPADFQEVQSWTMTAKGGGGRLIEGKASRDGGTRAQGTWYYYDVDLSSYAGTGYIAIRHYNCSDMFYLNIDDVAFVNSSKSGSTAYRVFRALCDGSELQMIADNVTQNYFIDTEWTNLAPGVYKYGICEVTSQSKGDIHWIQPGNGSTQHQPLSREDAEALGLDVDPSASFNGYDYPTRAMWDNIGYFSCNSAGQQAIATDGNFIYTGSWQGTPSGGYTFYKYTMRGGFIEGFNIDGVTQIRDLTYDGQYFYCGNGSSELYCVDLANQTLVGQVTTSCSAIRHCSYDSDRDGFWVGNWNNLMLINRSGALVQNAPNPTNAYGSGYYDNHLYLFTQANGNGDCPVYDYDIAANTLSSSPVASLNSLPGFDSSNALSGGAFIGQYGNKIAFFGNVQQSPNLVGIYELNVLPSAWSNCIEKTSVVQTINLFQGWNWFSTYIELDDPVELLQMLENGMGESGIQIEQVIDGVDMNGGDMWAGDLMSIGLMNEHTYMIEVTEDVTVELQGPATHPADHPITIYPNDWSWIGFPCAEEVDVNVALSGFDAEEGDMIETVYGDEGGIIYYYDGVWVGDFDTMIPGRGYMYLSHSNVEKTLIFQTGDGAKAKVNK